MSNRIRPENVIFHARAEHAVFLRREGLTYKAIGARLGVNGERARQMLHQAARRDPANRIPGFPYKALRTDPDAAP